MASIFHYTNGAGLIGIINSQSLYATHYRYLNDSREAAVLHDLMMPLLESEVAEVTPKLIKKNWLKPQFYEQYGTAGHLMQAQSIYDAIVRTIDNVSPFFVLSFCRHAEASEHSNNGLLSQWRGYAGSGGFAIEFDEDGIDSALECENSKFVYGVTKTANVQYNDYSEIFDVNQIKGLAGAMIGQLFANRNISAVVGNKNIDECIKYLITVAPFMKHAGFREECEYRMVLSPVRSRVFDKEPKFQGAPKPIKFRDRAGGITPYIEIKEFPKNRLPIKSIVVGPHPNQNNQRDAVALLLESVGLNVAIKTSDIPYLSAHPPSR